MRNPALFFLLSFALSWQFAFGALSDIERAQECFESYIKALQQGQKEKAKEFWNSEETKRYHAYDWQWEYLIFRKLDPRHLNYRITDSEEKNGFVVIEVEWYYREGKAGPIQKDIRYFIQQEDKMVGANSVLIHTRDWNRRESRHFVYHHKKKQDVPTGELLKEMDRFYEKTVDVLQVGLGDKIDYFKCESPEEISLLFGLEPSLARSQTFNGVVASVQRFVPHEIVHIISYQILPRKERRIPAEYLSEGLAYYLGGASFFSPELLLFWAQESLKRGENVSLDSLMVNPFRYGANEGAGLVCSFVKFLIDTEKMPKFKQLFTSNKAYVEQRQALERIYDRSIVQLQEEWKEFVFSLNLPQVKMIDSIPGGRKFYIEDPLGDDKGDGDYIYPKNERAPTGIFDLTRFEIGTDDQVVYFRLRFANLNQTTISSDETLNGTFAAIAINDARKDGGNTKLFFDNGNMEFLEKDGYEFVIETSNAGVLLYDQNWVWQLLYLDALSEGSHIKGNEITFAIPKEMIGNPSAGWEYQVLIGGQKGGYKNKAFGVGKFMRVGRQPSPDQGGGGSDTDFNPDVYDILTPIGTDQIRILSNYDVGKGKKVVLPMIKLKQE